MLLTFHLHLLITPYKIHITTLSCQFHILRRSLISFDCVRAQHLETLKCIEFVTIILTVLPPILIF
jgi:hypothetical protein